jgi:hypothetical protein
MSGQADAYRELQTRIAKQQLLITELLEEHKISFNDSGHWGHVGDLGHVSRYLGHVIEYLSVPGPDREFEDLAEINGDEK